MKYLVPEVQYTKHNSCDAESDKWQVIEWHENPRDHSYSTDAAQTAVLRGGLGEGRKSEEVLMEV